MKKRNPGSINEHFDLKYGRRGTLSREEFEKKSQTYFIAELFKESRKKANLTQLQLAEKLNVKRTYISKIERASGEIRISTLKRIIEQDFGGKFHINIEL